MDGDGALRKNVAQKSATSTGRKRISKRLLSPNQNDLINPKKPKTSNNVNSPLDILDSDKTQLNSQIINETKRKLDFSKNIQLSNHDFEENTVKTNINNKRNIKNSPKTCNIETNTQVDDKKAKRRKTSKIKSPNVTINSEIVENESPITINSNDSNILNESQIQINESSNTPVTNKQYNTRYSSSSIELNHKNHVANDSSTKKRNYRRAPFNPTSRSRSLSTGRFKKKSKVNSNLNKSVENINKQEDFTSKKYQPFVLLEYVETIEKRIRDKLATPRIDDSEFEHLPCSEIKSESDDLDSGEQRFYLEDVKIEDMSPLSSHSNLSELFSSSRGCHIHLDRLSEKLHSSRDSLVSDKTIPNCQCNGEPDRQKHNQVGECTREVTTNTTIESHENEITTFDIITPDIQDTSEEKHDDIVTNNLHQKKKRARNKTKSSVKNLDLIDFNKKEHDIKQNRKTNAPKVISINDEGDKIEEHNETISNNRTSSEARISNSEVIGIEEDKNEQEKFIQDNNEIVVINKNKNKKRSKTSLAKNQQKSSAKLIEDISTKNTSFEVPNDEEIENKEDNNKTSSETNINNSEVIDIEEDTNEQEEVIQDNNEIVIPSKNKNKKRSRTSLTKKQQKSSAKLLEDISTKNASFEVPNDKEIENKEDNNETSSEANISNSEVIDIEEDTNEQEEVIQENSEIVIVNKNKNKKRSRTSLTKKQEKSSVKLIEDISTKNTFLGFPNNEEIENKEDNKETSTETKISNSEVIDIEEDKNEQDEFIQDNNEIVVINKNKNKKRSRTSLAKKQQKSSANLIEDISTENTFLGFSNNEIEEHNDKISNKRTYSETKNSIFEVNDIDEDKNKKYNKNELEVIQDNNEIINKNKNKKRSRPKKEQKPSTKLKEDISTKNTPFGVTNNEEIEMKEDTKKISKNRTSSEGRSSHEINNKEEDKSKKDNNSKQEEDIHNNKPKHAHAHHHHHHHQHHTHTHSHTVTNNEHQNKRSRSSSSKNETKPSTITDDISTKNVHLIDTNKKEHDIQHNRKKCISKDTHFQVSNDEKMKIENDNIKTSNNKEEHKITETKKKRSSSNTHSEITNKEVNTSSKNIHSKISDEQIHRNKEDNSSKNVHNLVTNKKKSKSSSSGNEKPVLQLSKDDPNSTKHEEHKIQEDVKKSSSSKSTSSKGLITNKDDVKKSTSHKNKSNLTKHITKEHTNKDNTTTEESHLKLIQKPTDRFDKKHINPVEKVENEEKATIPKMSAHKITVKTPEKQHQNSNTTEKTMKTLSPRKLETSFQKINTSHLDAQITSLEQHVKNITPQNVIKQNSSLQKVQSPQKIVQKIIRPTFKDSQITTTTKNSELNKMVEPTNLNNITRQLSNNTDNTKSDLDLRQKISEKRINKDISDTSNKYKNFVIKASTTNRIVLDNSVPSISKLSPNKNNQSPISDEPNKFKIKVLDKVIDHTSLKNAARLSESTIVTRKLNTICNEQLSITINNDYTRNETSTSVTRNENENETETENEHDNKNENNISDQNDGNDFVFTKPKHTFKFIEKCEVLRPPTRKLNKITIHRPPLQPTPTTQPTQTVFKAPLEKKPQPKINRAVPPSIIDDDVISILADPSGLESVCDAASVRNDDSDYEEEINEAFMDKERFTQVKHWLTNAIDEPVTPVPEPLIPSTSPLKKAAEIPVARVNPGIQIVNTSNNSEEKSSSLSNESNNREERSNIKLVPDEKKFERFDRPTDIEIFKSICYIKFKIGFCKKKKCFYTHSLPNNWESVLKSFPIDTLLRAYRFAKDFKLFHLCKMILPIVAGQLGSFNDFNNLTNLVKDILEMNMNTDREPLIKDIIQALVVNGFSYYSTVEIIFRTANVEQGFKNLLCDILLNLTVERKQLEDDWPLIQMLSAYKKFNIDKGIIQFIIIEAFAKTYLQKELIVKVYNDLIKKVPDFNMKTISATLCEKFIEMLRKYNLQADADNLMDRCVSLNILEKRIKKQPITEPQPQPLEESPKSNCSSTTKETKPYDFPPPIITKEYETEEHQPIRPPSYPEFQPQPELSNQQKQLQQEQYSQKMKQEQPNFHQTQNHNQIQVEQNINLKQQQHQQYQPQQKPQEYIPQQQQYQPQQKHFNPLIQYQPEQKIAAKQLQNEQLNYSRKPGHVQQFSNKYQPRQKGQKYQPYQPQSQKCEYQPTKISQIEYQPQQYQKHKFESAENDISQNKYKQQALNYPILPGVRPDQQNYNQYLKAPQSNTTAQSYYSDIHQPEPSTSSQSNATITTNTQITPNNDIERFVNLDLLANAAQNILDTTRNEDINAMLSSPNLKLACNYLGIENKIANELYTRLTPSPNNHSSTNTTTTTSSLCNFSEVKQIVAEENFASIMQLILKYKEGMQTDIFLSNLIASLIETPHNYPTFFNTLSKMSELTNDNSLNYILKTIGVNLILYLCENNQCEPAIRINNILTTKCKSSDFYDVYNCKIYLKNSYSYMKRILIIAQMYIIKDDAQTAWNMLRDHVLSCGNYLQNTHDEIDLQYRDFVLVKLFESFKKIKNCHIALDALLFLMKYKNTDMNIQEHANSILVNAINNHCSFEKIEELMIVAPNWYQHLGKNTIRAILVKAFLDHKESVQALYQIGLNLGICPHFVGNERSIILYGYYHYAELQIYLDKFFQNMVNYMPVTDEIIITVSLSNDSSNDEIPLLMQQYNASNTVLANRVANILENIMKPPIKILNRKNCLYLEPNSVNNHLRCRYRL